MDTFRGCLILGMSGNEVYPAAVAISIAKMMNDHTSQSWEHPSSKTNPYICLLDDGSINGLSQVGW